MSGTSDGGGSITTPLDTSPFVLLRRHRRRCDPVPLSPMPISKIRLARSQSPAGSGLTALPAEAVRPGPLSSPVNAWPKVPVTATKGSATCAREALFVRRQILPPA